MWMRDRDAKSPLVHNFLNDADSVSRVHFAPAQDKWLDAMMLTGHDLVPPQLPTVIITTDAQPGDTGTTATITVGGPHIISSLETIGDQDYFAVQLEAGQAYEIGQYAYVGGPNAVPLPDCYVEVLDSAGNLIVSGDGGAPTLLNNLNSGFDVLMTFTPETTGTYYINARAFDQDPVNGTDGDFVGDYELFVQEASANAYQPYYDPDSPLYSIDWGTQVDGSSRNPDGAEGPRPTDNEFTGHAWNPYGIQGKNVITYYFARQGEIFIDEDPTTPGTTDTIVASGFEDWEKDVYLDAFGAYSKVADIVYVEVQSRTEADFVLITYEGTPGPGVSLLGRMSPPDEENEGRTEFNANDERWTEDGLQPGGFSFTTLIHELGHGHGLAHPHDNGGHSGIMRGVESDGVAFSYTNGDFDLNQSVFTMMSYEDGWEKSPYGSAETTDPFGWLGSLMAFDVAVIQDKYGVNEEWAVGNNTYVLKDVNAAGTYYECLWDAGGTDQIVYSGARDANIDLRAASLQYEFGGGGWISYAFGVFGGFTIANGVTIENATSGSGNDTLIGNGADNVLNGGLGDDLIDGGAGLDTASYAGTAMGIRVNLVLGSAQNTVGAGIDTLTSIENVIGGNGNDKIYGSQGNNSLGGGAGNDQLFGRHGDDMLCGGAGDDLLNGADGGDTASYAAVSDTTMVDLALAVAQDTGSAGLDTLVGIEHLLGGTKRDIFYGDLGGNLLDGRAGDDRLMGREGDDILVGGKGLDKLWGGSGSDLFRYESAAESVAGASDILFDFSQGTDRIDLGAIDANSDTVADEEFRFVGSDAFSGNGAELRYSVSGANTLIEADVNGDQIADFSLVVAGNFVPVATDFIL